MNHDFINFFVEEKSTLSVCNRHAIAMTTIFTLQISMVQRKTFNIEHLECKFRVLISIYNF